MSEQDELKLRTMAIQWHQRGVRFTEICRRLGRSGSERAVGRRWPACRAGRDGSERSSPRRW
jgi:hypothetical protein